MRKYDYLIIGGGIAGTIAAETLRKAGAEAKIAILEQEPHPLYSRVLIPSYLKSRIRREKLFLRKTADYESANIDFYPETAVSGIDFVRKEVFTKSGPDGKEGEVYSYKKLLVASGGRPKPWLASSEQQPATSLEQDTGSPVLRMHTLDDADKILEEIKKAMSQASEQAPQALVIGEGFIAMEFIETFLAHDFTVHVLARGGWWAEAKFGNRGADILEENFRRHKIIIHKNAEITLVKGNLFYLSNSERVRADIAGAGIGLLRNLEAYHVLGVENGILTNEFLQTSDSDVYAAGDAAEFYDMIAGRKRIVGNWTNAFLQGRTAAINMLASLTTRSGLNKNQEPFRAVPTYNIVNLGFNITAVGDLEEADDFWELADDSDGRFLKIFLKSGKTIGGVLINRFNDKLSLSKAVEKGISKNDLEKTFR